MHTGNIRGALLPVNKFLASCDPDDITSCYGGAARRTTIFDKYRAINPNRTLLFDSGNFFVGSLFFSHFKGTASKNFLNLHLYDAIALGSTEFSSGPVVTRSLLNNINSKISPIASNLDVSQEPLLSDRITRYDVKIIDGHEIGILALSPSDLADISSPGDNIVINPEGTAIQSLRAAKHLLLSQHESCKIIVVLSDDEALTNEVSLNVEDIDIIIDNGDLRSKSDTTNPYPKVVTNVFNEKVLIVSLGRNLGQYVGLLNVSFNDDGKIMTHDGDSYRLTNDIVSDSSSWSSILNYYDELIEINTNVIGSTDIVIENPVDFQYECRRADCNLGRLVTQSMLYVCPSCDVAFMNAGGLDSIINIGNITRGQILTAVRFQNYLATFDIRGSALFEACRISLQHWKERQDTNSGGGGFLQMSNLRFAHDQNDILEVQIYRQNIWESVKVSSFYKVVTNDFIRNGGDDYDVFKNDGINFNDFLPLLWDVVTDYIKAKSPINTTNIPTTTSLQSCIENVGDLEISQLQDQAATVIWPNQVCVTLQASGVVNILERCVTNTDACNSIDRTNLLYNLGYTSLSSFTCDTCSGLGTCSLQTCQCATPQLGTEHAGQIMIKSSKCDEIRDQWTLSYGSTVAIYVICISTLIYSFLTFLLIAIYRNNSILRRHSVLFQLIAVFGGIFAPIGVLLTTVVPNKLACGAGFSLVSMSFIIMFSAIFVKIYRLDRIFNIPLRQKLPKFVVDSAILKMFFLIVFMEVCFLILIQFSSPLVPTNIYLEKNFQYYIRCDVEENASTIYALNIFNMGVLCWGVYLSIRTRNIHQQFNEARTIGLTIYNAALITVIIYILTIIIDKQSPEAETLVMAILSNYLVVFTIAVLTGRDVVKAIKGKIAPITTSGVQSITIQSSGVSRNDPSMMLPTISDNNTRTSSFRPRKATIEISRVTSSQIGEPEVSRISVSYDADVNNILQAIEKFSKTANIDSHTQTFLISIRDKITSLRRRLKQDRHFLG